MEGGAGTKQKKNVDINPGGKKKRENDSPVCKSLYKRFFRGIYFHFD